MEGSVAGKLLVATPELIDPNFARTVVFMLEHDAESGALGVVLNRPSDAAVEEYLPEWGPMLAEPRTVFVGGPVTPDVAIGVVDTPETPPEDWSPVMEDIGLFDLSRSPVESGGVLRARVFAGYAGWMPGQLEGELLIRSWFVVEAKASDVFGEAVDDLWRTVLARQPAPLSWFANFPNDLTTN